MSSPNRPVPEIKHHLARGNTNASRRRANQRMVASVNNPVRSDVINHSSTVGGGQSTQVYFSGAATGASPEPVTWQGTNFDDGSWWSAGSPGWVTIPADGRYQIISYVKASGFTIAQSVHAKIYNNGSAVTVTDMIQYAASAAALTWNIVTVLTLTAGDKISMAVNGFPLDDLSLTITDAVMTIEAL